MRDVVAGLVTVVAASTGSGKSMMLPGALADQSDHQIIVLAPRRFLAMDAAFNVAELAELKIGAEVGYALGQMDGESAQRSHDTRLLYCTYGYAISSGLINKAQTVVLDEVHEADEQISLARAILYQRKSRDPALRLLEMSATVDAQAQARYWQTVAKTAVHIVAAKALACDVIHESPSAAGTKERSAEQIVVDLLEQGRKGIILFRPGVREVENSVLALKNLLAGSKHKYVEVVGMHGGTPSDQRHQARKIPQADFCKIIVGTNVIESGVNLRWLDAGVSDGFRKIPYHRDDTGAAALVSEDLPQAGLLQQIGRVNRDPATTGFERGLFVLHAKKNFEMRRPQNGPSLQRQALSGIAFHAASLGYNPTRLTWDIASNVHHAALPARLDQAKQELIRLGLMDADWRLTRDGAFIKHLPVTPETGALLCEASRLDAARMRAKTHTPRVMRDAVIMAALIESHGLRHDPRKGHKADQHRTSDLLDGMNAFRILRRLPLAQTILDATESFLAAATDEQLAQIQKDRAVFTVECLKHNVSFNGFVEVARLADEITARLVGQDKGIRVEARRSDDTYDAERYGELQQCILNAHANRLFLFENEGARDLLRDFGKNRNDWGQPFNGYRIGRSSIVPIPLAGSLMLGTLREVQAESKESQIPLIVLTEVTMLPVEVFINWALARAALHQPVVSKVVIDKGILAGLYVDKAGFEMILPARLHALARGLLADQENQ